MALAGWLAIGGSLLDVIRKRGKFRFETTDVYRIATDTATYVRREGDSSHRACCLTSHPASTNQSLSPLTH